MSDLHRLLQRQLRKAARPDGTLDLDCLLDLVSRTYAEDEEDSRRTDRSIQLMVGEIEDANRSLARTGEELKLTLESVQHGIMMIDAAGRIHVCNAQARELLTLPPEIGVGTPLDALAQWLNQFPVIGEEDGAAIIAVTQELFVEVHVRPTAERGCVVVVEDVTSDRQRERALRQAEGEYRSLFENSVSGIYRDRLDGSPVRVNPALAQLNGYATEDEHIRAVTAGGFNWYVDADRVAEFTHILKRDGRVRDFVSEVRRHKTGDTLWVTENAWYVRDADGTPQFIEGTIQDASERIAAEEAMVRLANLDVLTGARSRFHFMRRLEEEVARPDQRFALYCIDLDMFKDVNDVFGHAAGDAVLKTVAERLTRLASTHDTVARLGGDEFAILSQLQANLDEPENLARAIVEAMRTAVQVEGRNHHVGASVGIALFPSHGLRAEDLLRSADMALYKAKSAGRNGWRLFDRELRDTLEHNKRIEDELRGALERNEIALHFQKIVHANGELLGFESLMRWSHPSLGNVAPARFIPIAEKSGLMGALGSFAITHAVEAIAALPAPLRVTVNVSANQFRMPGFFAHVRDELARCGVDPRRFTLEITESVLVESGNLAGMVLGELRQLGVQIAIDDFGTGYSSLSYLQQFPINCVKIDRSFVAGITKEKANMAVIRAVIGIGRDLDINVIAEGIETAAQADILRREGCRLLQGFLFGHPTPLADVMADIALSRLSGLTARAAARTA